MLAYLLPIRSVFLSNKNQSDIQKSASRPEHVSSHDTFDIIQAHATEILI